MADRRRTFGPVVLLGLARRRADRGRRRDQPAVEGSGTATTAVSGRWSPTTPTCRLVTALGAGRAGVLGRRPGDPGPGPSRGRGSARWRGRRRARGGRARCDRRARPAPRRARPGVGVNDVASATPPGSGRPVLGAVLCVVARGSPSRGRRAGPRWAAGTTPRPAARRDRRGAARGAEQPRPLEGARRGPRPDGAENRRRLNRLSPGMGPASRTIRPEEPACLTTTATPPQPGRPSRSPCSASWSGRRADARPDQLARSSGSASPSAWRRW